MRRTVVVLFALCVVPGAFAQSGGPIQTATVTLTATQLQHLKTAPVELVPAPGAGKVILDVSQQFQYKFGTTPYTVSADGKFSVYISSANSAGFYLNAAGFLDQSTSQLASGANSGTSSTSQSSGENSPLMIRNVGSQEFADGDGTVAITVYYAVVTLQ